MKGRISIVIIFVMLLTLFFPGSQAFAAEEKPEKIEVLVNPKTTEYCVGDTFRERGLSVMVTYESGNTRILNSGFSTNADFSTAGNKDVTVFYTEARKTVSTNLSVKVYEKPVITTETANVARGASFKVPVYISGNCGLMGFEIDLQYDENSFVPIKVETADIFSSGEDGGKVNDNIGSGAAGKVSVIWAGTEPFYKSGKLFEVEFFCKENAASGGQVISVTADRNNTFTEKYNAITCVGADSAVAVGAADDQNAKPDDSATKKQETSNNEADNKDTSDKGASNKNTANKTVSDKNTANGDKKDNVINDNTKVLVLNTPVIKSVKNVRGKKASIKLAKKSADAKGYEVRYSLKKNMKASKQISGSSLDYKTPKLKKGKKYYFSARAYTTVNNKKYYSDWSSVKSVKIRK